MTLDIRLQARASQDPLWVFAYGSLMWSPGFPFQDSIPALVYGWRRSLCIQSVTYRGTAERPGLVLGLDRGGSCRGLAFLIAEKDRQETLNSLDQRELHPDAVYHARWLSVRLASGQTVRAYGYVANREHPHYVGSTANFTKQATLVAQGTGLKGRCRDYLAMTLTCLARIGIQDQKLVSLLETADTLVAIRQDVQKQLA